MTAAKITLTDDERMTARSWTQRVMCWFGLHGPSKRIGYWSDASSVGEEYLCVRCQRTFTESGDAYR